MSIKHYPGTFASYVITMLGKSGALDMHRNVRISLQNHATKGTPDAQLMKFLDKLDAMSLGSLKYCRKAMGAYVQDKPTGPVDETTGNFQTTGHALVLFTSPENPKLKQWINVPFVPIATTEADMLAFAQWMADNLSLAVPIITPGVATPNVYVETSEGRAFPIKARAAHNTVSASGQTFDDNGADGMSGSAD